MKAEIMREIAEEIDQAQEDVALDIVDLFDLYLEGGNHRDYEGVLKKVNEKIWLSYSNLFIFF